MKYIDPQTYSDIQRRRSQSLKYILSRSKTVKEKRVNTLKDRYGNNYFSNLSLKGLQRARLSEFEERAVNISKNDLPKNITIDTHRNLYGQNFDIVYKDEINRIIAVEEVLGTYLSNRNYIFFELLCILQKRSILHQNGINVPFFITTTFKQNRLHKFPLDPILWLLENNFLPVFLDIEESDKLKHSVLCSNDINIDKLSGFLTSTYNTSTSLSRSFLEARRVMNSQEVDINNAIFHLSPFGKTIFKTKYNTFLVSDNAFQFKNNLFAVFASKTKLNSVIGSAFMIKELVSSEIKTLCVLENPRDTIMKNTKVQRLIKTYADLIFYSFDDFKEWACRSTEDRSF